MNDYESKALDCLNNLARNLKSSLARAQNPDLWECDRKAGYKDAQTFASELLSAVFDYRFIGLLNDEIAKGFINDCQQAHETLASLSIN